MRVTVPCARHAHVGSGAAQRRSPTWMRLWTGSTPPAERLVWPRCAIRLPSRALLSVLWAVDMHVYRWAPWDSNPQPADLSTAMVASSLTDNFP
jgi:hypothetical protein